MLYINRKKKNSIFLLVILILFFKSIKNSYVEYEMASSRPNFDVLINAIKSNVSYSESVTYTTHATVKYLNLVTRVLQNWDGPISIAVYAPGYDLE